jgi:thymidylate synthase
MIVSAWNPSVLPDNTKSFEENVANNKAALPPCHAFFQFYVQW